MKTGGPYFVIPTRKGAVPWLTPTQARAILDESERLISVSVFDAVDYASVCEKVGMSFAAFCGLADFNVVLTLRTSFLGIHPSAASTDAGICGDHQRGRSTIIVSKWVEMVKALKPTMAVQPSESVSLSEPSAKKRKTALTRTIGWSTKIAESEGELRPCQLLKPVSVVNGQGGFLDVFTRNENIRELHAGLSELELSVASPSLLYAYSMPAIIAAIGGGVQLVESTLPWELADKGVALNFTLDKGAMRVDEGGVEAQGVEIDLNDDAYMLDIGALSAGCECYTCRRHNRAYIHHLLTVQEMNSSILLSIHNLHMLVRVFRRARELREDRKALDSFLMGLLSQY